MSTTAQNLSCDDVAAKVKTIVAEALHAQKMVNQMTENTYLENLGLDSLNIVDILLGIETEFGITFDEDELDLAPLQTIGTLITFVKDNLETNG